MKFKKEIIIMSLIICMLFTISSVCAVDSEIQAISAHNSTDTVVSTVNDDDLEMNEANEILAETDDGSFTALNTTISSAAAGSTVDLWNNYTFDASSSTIAISTNNLVIDGHGVTTIDAKGYSNVFSVTGQSVTIKNIKFINGVSSNGGVIESNNAFYLNIKNCTFINNRGSVGAVYMYYADCAVIEDCTFINNTGTNVGAISWMYYEGEINRCTFINNSGDTAGSIYWAAFYGDGNISNSIFINNEGSYDVAYNNRYASSYNNNLYADFNWWGQTSDDYNSKAPRVNSALSITKFYVLNMILGDSGASVSLNNLYDGNDIIENYAQYSLPDVNLSVKGINIDVVDCVVLGSSGTSTIHFTPEDAYSITINYNGVGLTREVKPTFKSLKDKINSPGSEITLEQDYIYDSTKDGDLTNGIDFAKDMTIDGQGHIIDAKESSNIFYFNDDTDLYSLTLKNIIFANATGDNGAAVYFKGKKIEIINCTFINNKADYQGDAVYIANANSDSNKITQSTFKDNIGTNSVLYINLDSPDARLELTNSVLMGNDATYNVKGTSNVIVDYNWWGNTAENYNDDAIAKVDGVTLNKWLFAKIDAEADKISDAVLSLNNLYENGGNSTYADYALPTVTFTLGGSNVENTKTAVTLDANGQATYRFTMWSTTASLTASYDEVTVTKTLEYIIVDDGSFRALSELVWFNSELELTHDYVYSDSDTITEGILIQRKITINGNGNIIDAKGKTRIFTSDREYDYQVTFNNISFINGKAEYASAILIDYYCDNYKIINCNFTNNTATNYGGVIDCIGDYCTIDNCNFINNSAVNSASVIRYYHDHQAYIKNSNFINNTVSNGATGGGVIHADDGRVNIDKSTFINNSAQGMKAAVLYAAKQTVTITNSVLLNNTGAEYILYRASGLNVQGSWFGNTFDNLNAAPNNDYIYAPEYLYLDFKFTEENVIISLNNLYAKNTATSSVYSNYNLPEITLNINSTNLNLNTDKVTLDSTGKAIVPYTKIANDAALTVSYEGISLTKDCVVGEFDVLQELIDTTVGDTIELNRNYTFIEGVDTLVNGISITRDITIDGNGSTIDGSNLARIFSITTNGVTLKNINFVNGYASQGGAIYNSGGFGFKLINCTFENNVANNDHGGAIYINSNGVNDFVNCTFIGNKITASTQKNGGAIYIYEYSGQNNFVGCTFTNNTATGYGGAIATASGKAITNIDKSVFITNTAAAYSSIYIYGGTSAEFYLKNSIIFSKGFTTDTSTQVRVNSNLRAGDVNNNWWMHTSENYIKPGYIRYNGGGLTVTKWLFLDMNCEDEIATISLNNLYDSSTQTYSTYDGELPQIAFDLSGVNVKIDDNATLNKNGVGEAEFDITDQTGSITATYNSVSITKSVVLDDSFTALQHKISRAPEGSELILYHDYNYDGTKDTGLTDGIVIDKELTIDGQGFTLDAKDVARIFKTDDNSKNIVFKNIKFTNAHASDGAAVYANCNNIDVINCTFEANEATNNGDALYVIANGCDISESTFINNLGTQSALYLASDLQDAPFNIDNSILVNNAGANIVKDDKIALTANNNWWGNTVDNINDLSGGLAQKWYLLDMTVDNTHCIATISLNNLWDGSAYSPCETYALPTIVASIQTNTYASARKDKVSVGKEGDTVGYIATDETNVGTITVSYNGISVTREVSYDEDSDYSFKALKKLIDGSQDNEVIVLTHDYEYVIGYDDITSGIDIVQNNLTINGNGYTIDAKGQTRIFNVGSSGYLYGSNLTIKNATFANGKMSANGGAISWYGDDGNLANCTFVNNTVTGYKSGGALNIQSKNMKVFNVTFSENKATSKGGAIYISSDNVLIEKSTFIKNDGGSNGGAIYWNSGDDGTIIDSTFIDNYATSQGGALEIGTYSGDITVVNSTFVNNKVTSTGHGGAIYWGSPENRNIINSTFRDNYASSQGGALYWYTMNEGYNGIMYNSIFINNTALNGGAIYIFSGRLDIDESDFINNTATAETSAVNGGAIYFMADSLNINNTNFIGNAANTGTSTSRGGALYVSSTYGKLNINNSTFTKNSAYSKSGNSYGGVMHVATNCNVANSTFIDNSATVGGSGSTYGGAFYWYGAKGNISRSSFINNAAKSGGAIFGSQSASQMNVTNSIFINNKLSTYNSVNVMNTASSGLYNFTECWFGNTRLDGYTPIGLNTNSYIKSNRPLCLELDSYDELMIVDDDKELSYFLNYVEDGTKHDYDSSKLPKINLTLSTVKADVDKNHALVDETILFNANQYGSVSITAKYYDLEYTEDLIAKLKVIITVDENPIVVHVGEHKDVTGISLDPATLSYISSVADGDEYIGLDSNYYLVGLKEGESILTITTSGDSTHAPTTLKVPVRVIKYTTVISTNLTETEPVDEITVDWGSDSQTIILDFNPGNPNPTSEDISKFIIHKKSNDTSVATVSVVDSTHLAISFRSAGTANITIYFEENERYYGSEKNVTVTVNKVQSAISFEPDELEFTYGSFNSTVLTLTGCNVDLENIAVLDSDDNPVLNCISFNGNVITVSNLNFGTYTLRVTSTPDANHTSVTETLTVTVNKADSSVGFDGNLDFNYEGEGHITLVDLVGCDVNLGDIAVDGHTEAVINYDDQTHEITVSGLDAGDYTLIVSTEPYSNYNSVDATLGFTVSPIDSSVSFSNDIVFDYLSSNTTTLTLVGCSVDEANIAVDGHPEAVISYNSESKVITVSNLSAGTYTLKVTTTPDGNHNSVVGTAGITVNKIDSSVEFSNNVVFDYGGSGTTTLTNFVGCSVEEANIVVDGHPEAVVAFENNVITVSNLSAGTYTLKVTTTPDSNYNSIVATAGITVNKIDSSVSFSNDVVFDYGGSGTTDLTLVGCSVEEANIVVDGHPEAVIGFENNVITVSGLNAGTYTLKVTSTPDGNHLAVTETAEITVNKVDSSVNLGNIEFNYEGTGTTALTDYVGCSVDLVNITVDGHPEAVIGFENDIITVSGLDAGSYTLKVTTTPDENHNSVDLTSEIAVNKIDSSFSISNDIVFDYLGFNTTTLADFIGCSVDLENITVDGHPEAVITLESNVITVSGLDAGTYTLKVISNPDANHNSVVKTADITVNKIDSSVVFSDDVVFDYGVSGTTALTLVGCTVDEANIAVDGHPEAVIAYEGNTITVSNLSAGTYTLKVTTTADSNYNSIVATADITVNKVDSSLSFSNDIVFDYGGSDSTDLTLVGCSVDEANIVVDGHPEAVIGFENNVITVSGLNAGTYTLKVTSTPDGNHLAVTETADITVNKVDSSVSFGNIEFDYEGTGTATLTDYVGCSVDLVNITVVDHPEAVIGFENNVITVSGLDAGLYTLKVTTTPDENHNSVDLTSEIAVNKIDSSFSISNDIVFDYLKSNTTTLANLIGCSVDLVNITVVGHPEAVITLEDNVINVSGLGAGAYTLKVSSTPDSNHISVDRTATITVNKIDSEVTFLPGEIHLAYDDEGSTIAACIGCTIDEANVTVLNHPEAVIKLEGNKITVSGLVEDEYTMKVITTPDSNHNSIEATIKVTVSGISPKMEMQVTNITVGEKEIVFITMNSEATGIVNITILDGDKVVETRNITINNRFNKTEFTGLKVGEYAIIAYYYGTQNYNEVTIPDMFTVHPIYNFEFAAEADDTVYGNKTNVTVTLSPDASGSIQIGNIIQTIEGPVTVIELPIQNKPGKNNVVVKYIPDKDSKYGADEIVAYYNVAKKSAEITIADIAGIKVGDDVEIIASAYEGAEIVFYLDNVKLDSNTIENVAAGTHTIVATVAETGVYLAASANKTFSVAKYDVDISVSGTPTKVGEKSTITVTTDASSGRVIVSVNGTEYSLDLSETNTLEVVMPNVGTVPLTAKLLENDKYNAQDAVATTIEVTNKTASDIVIQIPIEVKVGKEVTINVTTPNNATLTVTINDVEQTVSEGKVVFTPSEAGIYNIVVRTEETPDYFADVAFDSFEITKNVADITIEDIGSKKVGDDVLINVSTNSDGDIFVYVDGELQVLDENNTVTIIAVAGTHTIIVNVGETGEYYDASSSVDFTVDKYDVDVIVSGTPAKVGEKSTITVTTDADSGMVIVGINGTEYSLNLSETNTLEVVMPNVGTVPLTARYLGDDRYNAKDADATTIEVTNKTSSDIVIQIPDEIKVGDVITINVTTTNDELEVTINDIKQDVVDGKITFTATEAGVYNIVARTNETAEIFGEVKFDSFKVTKKAAEITIEDIDPKKVGDDVLINVSAYDGANIVIYVDGVKLDSNTIENVSAGTHTIIASVAETDEYLPATANKTFTVTKYDVEITVNGTQTKVGEKSTITVNCSADMGIVIVNVNGTEYSINLGNGNTLDLVMPNVGTVPLTARYLENDRYNAKDVEATTIEVTNKTGSDIVIQIPDEIKVGDVITINVTTANDELEVTINDIKQDVVDGKITFTAAEAGVYNIVVRTNETAEIFGEVKFGSFEVTRKVAEITIEDIDPKKAGDDVLINVSAYDGANIVIYVDGVKLDSNTIENVSAGTHTIIASVAETDEYLPATANKTFTVTKYDALITIEDIDPKKAGDDVLINVSAYDGADIVIYVDGVKLDSNTIENVSAGTHTVVASVAETYEYLPATANMTFTVTKYDVEITVSGTDTKVGEKSTVTVNCSADMGIVIVNVNGTEYSINLTNGNTFDVVMPNVGTVPLTARYLENDRYNAKDAQPTGFIVFNKASFDIIIQVPSDVKVKDNITISVIAPTDVEVTINDIRHDVVDGKINFTAAEAGIYNIVARTNETSDYFEAVKFASFEVTKRACEITIDDIAPKKVGDDVEVVVSAYEGADVVIYVDGVKLDSNTIENVSAGTHTIVASVAETDEYLSATVNKTFTVTKYDVDVNVSATAVFVGEKSTITVEANVTEGIVIININGTEYSLNLTNGNTLEVVMNTQGSVPVKAQYLENNKYNAKQAQPTDIVVSIKQTPALTIQVNKTSIVGEQMSINVTTDGYNLTAWVLFDSEIIKTANGNFTFTPQKDGVYTIIAKTTENDTYYAAEQTASFAALNRTKESPSITISEITDAKVGEEITFTVDAIGGGDAIVKINDEIITSQDGVYRYTPKKGGLYVLTVETPENERYSKGFNITTFTVDKKQSEINITVIGGKVVDDNTQIKIECYDGAVVSVFMDEQAIDYTKTFKATSGDHLIIASVAETDEYLGSSANYTFTVAKKQSSISVSGSHATVGEESLIEVTLTKGATGLVIVNVNGTDYTLNITENDSLSVVLNKAGVYDISAKYLGDEKYESSESEVNTMVADDKQVPNIEIEITPYGIYVGDTVFVEITCDSDAVLDAYLDGEKQTLIDGKFIIENVTVGIHVVEVVSNETSEYKYAFAGEVFKADKKQSEVTIRLPDTITVGEDVEVNITSTSDNDIVVYVDGERQTLTDGKLYIKATAGVHTIIAGVDENAQYLAATANKTFAVEKLKATFEVSADNVTLGQATTITITTELSEGVVVVRLNDTEVAIDLAKSKAVTVVLDAPGVYELSADYLGSDNYNNASTTGSNIEVTPKADPAVEVDVPQAIAGENETISVSIPNATGNVHIIIDGMENVVPLDENGNANYTIPEIAAGNHSIVVVYPGDETHDAKVVTQSIEVPKQTTKANITVPSDVQAGDNATVKVEIPDATGNVTVIVDGVENSIALVNGTAEYPLENITSGNHSVVVIYPGDETHDATYGASSFEVPQEPVIIQKATEITDIVVDGKIITAVLKDVDGNVIPRAKISYTVDGVSGNATTDSKGSFTIRGVAKAVVDIDYAGDETYLPTNTSITLSGVEPAKSDVYFELERSVVESYSIDRAAGESGKEWIVVTLKDANGTVMAYAPVQFTFDGKVYNYVTDENGMIRIQDNKRIAQNYTGTFVFLGDETHNSNMSVVTLVVKQKIINIIAPAKTFKAKTKTKKYTITLKTYAHSSADGKVHMNGGYEVKFTINGKTYKGKTNAKGQVTFNLNLTKKAKYIGTVRVDSNKGYKGGKKTTEITIK